MTTLEAVAQMEARAAYAAARRRHERAALLAYRSGRPLTGHIESAAVKRLQRYAPSETLVVREIGL